MAPERTPQRGRIPAEREAIAVIVAAVAADIDAVMTRTASAMQRLEAARAEPNLVVATRRAAERLADDAAAFRREALLSPPQQQLL